MFTSRIRDDVTATTERILRKLQPGQRLRVLLQWGASVRKVAQENALKKGGRRFWREIARSVKVKKVSQDAVVVQTEHYAAAQMEYGGIISAPGKHSASPAQALTIPITGSEAEGRRASEFTQPLFVAPKTNVLGYSEDGVFVPLFVLVKAVRGPKNPWWPKQGEVRFMGERLAKRALEAA